MRQNHERIEMSTLGTRPKKPPMRKGAMPEYLNFTVTLLELDPQEMQTRLREQTELLERAIMRLKETEKAPGDLFEKVVSI